MVYKWVRSKHFGCILTVLSKGVFMKKKLLLITAIFFLFIYAPVYGKGQQQTERGQSPSSVVTTSPLVTTASPIYWTGDGGKGIRLAVLEPVGKGLSANEQWMLSMIQSSITGDFQKFSAMTIIDRQNLEKILSEQKQSMSGNYSDDDYIRIGKLTNTRYILAGSITKTSSTFVLEFAITDAESGERKASYPPKATSPFALENLSVIKEATAELLQQLGVQLTNMGLKELNNTENIAQVKAETALAKGIEAQKQGTIVEALSYYIQANNYNTGLAEATSRMNILTANITSGNIGQDTRNDIAWRKDWVARLQETETFFSNSIKAPQPFYIVYSTDIKRGKIDYQKETTELSVWMGFYPDYIWAEQINEVVNAVKKGLQTAGRSEVWGIDWPAKSINTPSPFINQTKNLTSTVVVEIINSEGKSIGKQTVKSPYGFEIKNTVITPLWQWEGDVSFSSVNANLITDKLEIRITAIDGIAAENAARQKNISIMPLTEWESMLRKQPTIKQKIETEYYYNCGNAYLKEGDYDNAIACYTQAIKINPNYVDAYFNRGSIYYEKGDYDKAIADYTQTTKIDPNAADAYCARGNAYYIKSDYDRAIADYTQAIKLDPNWSYAYNVRANAYHGKQDYDRAFADYDKVIKLNPNDASAYKNRGDAYYYWKDDYDRAIADYTQAIRINPNYNDAYYGRAAVYYDKKNYDRAFADYSQVIKLNPNDADAYKNRGARYYDKEDYDRAIVDYTQVIRIAPNDSFAYYMRGSAYYKKKNYDKAIADFTQAIKIDPNDTIAYSSRGDAYYDKKDYDRAIADFTQAIQIPPIEFYDHRGYAYYRRGNVYCEKNDYDKAIADFTEAIQIDSDYADAYYARGNAYLEDKYYDLAIADYTQSIRINPNDADAYYNRGYAYSETKQYDMAIADYNQYIKLDPNYSMAYNNRGVAYKNKGDKNRAIADYETALRLDPNNTAAKNNLKNLRGY